MELLEVFPINIALDFLCFVAEPIILHLTKLGLNVPADVGEGAFFSFF